MRSAYEHWVGTQKTMSPSLRTYGAEATRRCVLLCYYWDYPDRANSDDVQPDETQRELMRRTALHILNSPNAGQLEMRILANHGADRRFAFLKGRWSRAWKIAKGHVRLDLEKEKAHKADVSSETGGGLGGLTGYGDSDDEGTSTSSGKGVEGMHEDERGSRDESGNACSSEPTKDDDEIVKSARRARAKEWAEKRRALQPGARDSDS